MALVSPGVSITVTDETQYASNAIGTVPLVVLATAENKTYNGTVCSGTTAANAGMLQVFTSQRDLTTALGAPIFQKTSAGTPINGAETNEYGLMAAYSALGLGNQLFAIRADIDLNALTGTSVRPSGTVATGTYWLDLADTSWGIYEWSTDTQTFAEQTPILITSTTNVTTSSPTTVVNGTTITLTNEPTPVTNIGQVGSYSVVATSTTNRIFHKTFNNTWALVGSTQWQDDLPVLKGTTSPTLTGSVSTVIQINSANVTVTATNITTVAAGINSAAITGVTAAVRNNQLCLFVDGKAKSNGSTVDGILKIKDWSGTSTNSLFVQTGIITAAQWTLGYTQSVYAPAIQYSNYAGVPTWNSNYSTAMPNGAVWFKQGALGGGSNFVFKSYNATTGVWTTNATDIATSEEQAIYDLDIGGGSNIAQGTLYVDEDPNTYGALNGAGQFADNLGVAGFIPYVRTLTGPLNITGVTPAFGVSTGTFTLYATAPGTTSYTAYTVTVAAATAASFVSGVLAASIPYVTASVTSAGNITLTHQAGGTIILQKITGQPNFPALAGFAGSTVVGVRTYSNSVIGTTNDIAVLSGFIPLTYTYSISQPVAAPVDGTLWYYSDPTTVDIMINTGSAWKGYQNVSLDARGYNLASTDANGVIVAATAPTTQSNGYSALANGDLWLDTADLENYPAISRWNGSAWIMLDNTDQISVNGILFADARWDGAITNGLTDGGTTQPGTSTVDSTVSLLTSDYLDLDAPNPLLYPRGMLLFNTRRSGYNVKRYVDNYFNTTAFSVATYNSSTAYAIGAKVLYGSTLYVANQATTGNVPTNTTYWTILENSAWVTASGLTNTGAPYAGHYAQRQMVVAAMNAALESNTEILEDQFYFSLICAPGYPEVIPNMVALNNNRSNTAFIIGDTPMNLSTNIVDITNWSNDTNGTGLATNDPYLAVYYPSGLTTDLSGNTIMVPSSHMALRTFLHSDNLSYPWFAPAGLRRGLVDNASDLGYVDYTTGEFMRTGVSQGLRDALYTNNINPITILPLTGIVVWGQKTRDPITQDMDRVNVSRLVNYVRTLLAKATYGFLFEPNDQITRQQAAAVVSSALNDLVSKRGVYDYVVVCDTTNNTTQTIQNNQLYIDVAIAPTIAVEFIYIPIRLVNPSTGAAGA